MFDTRLYEAHIPSPLPTSQSLHIPSLLSPSARPRPPPPLSRPPSSPAFLSLHNSDPHNLRSPPSVLLLYCFISFGIVFFSSWSTTNQIEMAQRTEKEETEFKVPETLTLCVNNCGVTGNPATNNMCQKCFNATTATSSSSPSSSSGATSPSATGGAMAGGSSILKFSDDKSSRSTPSRSHENRSDSSPPTKGAATSNSRTIASYRSGNGPAEDAEKKVVNRCSGCRKRVGLTGFRCRCGELFCAEHRYSDRHDCSYDYKSAGREAIARENPVVKAAKIIRV